MKRIITILLAALMLLSACAVAEGQFRVGMECDYPPFNWTQVEEDENSVPIDGGMGFAGGYDVEIAKRIAAGLGKELVIKKIAWDGLIPALNSDQIDAVIAGIHNSVAVRTASLTRRLGLLEPVAMTGGVAQNGGVRRALEEELGVKIRISPLCQLNGAWVAAIYGWNKIKE